jgi:excisionase family DNA binding protein
MAKELTPTERQSLERRRRDIALEQRREDRNLLLSMSEAAAELGLSEKSVYRMVSSGKLKPVYDRNRTWIHRDDIDLQQRIKDGLLFLGLEHEIED